VVLSKEANREQDQEYAKGDGSDSSSVEGAFESLLLLQVFALPLLSWLVGQGSVRVDNRIYVC
jgi:hypothetical protein